MKLDLVRLQDFRNLTSVSLTPSPSVNLVVGQNGSGKSSLLEGLHFLGFGRSFRTNKHRNVIQHDKKAFHVFGQGLDGQGRLRKLGVSRGNDDSITVNIDGEHSHRVAALVSQIPMQIFTPQSSDIIIGSPSLRRKHLDWGVFHVEHGFAMASGHYRRCLSHKNALLKSGSKGSGWQQQDNYWTEQLISSGKTITDYRIQFLNAIQPYLSQNLSQFLPEFCVEISYHRGWDKEASLEESIQQKAEKDQRFGFLSVGPHKADLKIKADGHDAAERLSRGQMRMLIAALQLAQAQYLNSKHQKDCVFLLDDVGAELDAGKREVFVDELLACSAQVFVTAIEQQQVPFIKKYNDYKLFHVEHGHVEEENDPNG
ncbi:DNA replication/repair protein RecF [Aestuariibacter halophilus]|uniref:DNA replication and repair protein RecF n=1 Tax=Fluctibacter halophilus TaxID=226011 RepID=A0ABS8G8L4_9ALTE|nr:DNA replication/repair protein RecF [Aestuariibacter halophilus]MCC2616922.1 DNA replication/repair protein RecF [Aestuariibacter halophilus]